VAPLSPALATLGDLITAIRDYFNDTEEDIQKNMGRKNKVCARMEGSIQLTSDWHA
jgi:hypothetical protein